MIQRINDLPVLSIGYSVFTFPTIDTKFRHLLLQRLHLPALRVARIDCSRGDLELLPGFIWRCAPLESFTLSIGNEAAWGGQVLTATDLEPTLAALATHTGLKTFEFGFDLPVTKEAISRVAAFIAQSPCIVNVSLHHDFVGERTPRSHYDDLYAALSARPLKRMYLSLPLDGARLGDAIGGMGSLEELSIKLAPTEDEYLVPEVDEDENEETDSYDENEESDYEDGFDRYLAHGVDPKVAGTDGMEITTPDDEDGDDGSGDGYNAMDGDQDSDNANDSDDEDEDKDNHDASNGDNNEDGSEDGSEDDNEDDNEDDENDHDEEEDLYLGAPGWDPPITVADGLGQYAPLLARLNCSRLRKLHVTETYYHIPAAAATELQAAAGRLPLEDLNVLVRPPDSMPDEEYADTILGFLSKSTCIRKVWLNTRTFHLRTVAAFDLWEPHMIDEAACMDALVLEPGYMSASQELQRRAAELCVRNFIAGRNVQDAAVRALAACRVLLCTVPPSRPVASLSKVDWYRLPTEVRLRIARHTSGNAEAFSDRQWAALSRSCADRCTLAAATAAGRKVRSLLGDEENMSEKEEWLRSLGLWNWDRNVSE